LANGVLANHGIRTTEMRRRIWAIIGGIRKFCREVRLQRLLVHGALFRIRVLSDGRSGDPAFERGSILGRWRPDAADQQLGRRPHRGQTVPVRFDDFRGHRDVSRIIEFAVCKPLKQTSD
jgi:hypothetical protein